MFDEMTHENPHQKAIVTQKKKHVSKLHRTPNSILTFMQFGLGEIVNFLWKILNITIDLLWMLTPLSKNCENLKILEINQE
jgi:hypothetical protein